MDDIILYDCELTYREYSYMKLCEWDILIISLINFILH